MINDYGICWGIPEASWMNKALTAVSNDSTGTFYYVEIGCAEGRTFSAVLKQLRRLNHRDFFGFAVDQPNGWSFSQRGFDQNLSEFRRGVDYDLFQKGGADFLNGCQDRSLDAVLIDACHEYKCCGLDFMLTEAKVKPGGLVVFHDTAEYAQGIDIQPHMNLPIGVRDALKDLSLLPCTRPGWQPFFEVPGNKDRDERGIIGVRKV